MHRAITPASRPGVFDPGVLTVDGIPLHPLVVHAVVVLLPLAAVGAVLVAVRPAWRARFGVPVLLIALVGVATVPVATLSGQQLRDGLPGPNSLIAEHEARGLTLLPVAIAFLVLLAVAVLAERRNTRGDRPGGPAGGGTAVATGSRVATAATVLAALAGVAVTVMVVWISHAGAIAVWSGVVR